MSSTAWRNLAHQSLRGPRRFAEVDVVKAVGILTVVWIHSLEPIRMPDAPFHAVWWAHVTRFAVPGFLAASGYRSIQVHATPLMRQTCAQQVGEELCLQARSGQGRVAASVDHRPLRLDVQQADGLRFRTQHCGDNSCHDIPPSVRDRWLLNDAEHSCPRHPRGQTCDRTSKCSASDRLPTRPLPPRLLIRLDHQGRVSANQEQE